MNSVMATRDYNSSLACTVSANPKDSELHSCGRFRCFTDSSWSSDVARESCNSNTSSDDRDLPPLLFHPLQSSLSCISVAIASRVKDRGSLAVSTYRIGAQPSNDASLLEILRRIHSPPTSASACLFSPVTAQMVKRFLHFVDERNNAPSRTLVPGI